MAMTHHLLPKPASFLLGRSSPPIPPAHFVSPHLSPLQRPIHSHRPDFSANIKKKNPWLDPFDDGADPEMEYGSLFADGKQEEDPAAGRSQQSLRVPKVSGGVQRGDRFARAEGKGDVRRCCCVVSGGVYENLLFFPLIQLLKNRYPGIQVDVIASSRGKQTYELNKNVRWANVYDLDDDFPEPAEYTDMVGVIKNRYYDMILSTKLAGIGHAAFLFMSTARDRVSYIYPNVNAAGAGLFLSETFTPPTTNLSEGGYNMPASPQRPKRAPPPFQSFHLEENQAFVEEKYQQAGVERGKFVVIHGIQSDSAASMRSKGDEDSLLPIQIWAEIVKALSRGLKPVFVIPHEKEREDVKEAVGEDSSIVFITTPGQLAALINDSAGVICTNTAAVQLAHARDKTSVALFSSDEKGRLFVPDAEEKRCTIMSSKSGKLIDIDVGVIKAAVGKLFVKSLVPV
ncbi:unnamed protein product [Spirodela intermedia]|uniref:Uncharacterized protein n=1 Tax=Spirodela intermedia TaxID=51605 RepID=A0A7I8JI93_SPIIN|nr:unnamed protein product [Spirodela intermedia]CAA6669877.1 unnamed protein product [Spirodela intermedia]